MNDLLPRLNLPYSGGILDNPAESAKKLADQHGREWRDLLKKHLHKDTGEAAKTRRAKKK